MPAVVVGALAQIGYGAPASVSANDERSGAQPRCALLHSGLTRVLGCGVPGKTQVFSPLPSTSH